MPDPIQLIYLTDYPMFGLLRGTLRTVKGDWRRCYDRNRSQHYFYIAMTKYSCFYRLKSSSTSSSKHRSRPVGISYEVLIHANVSDLLLHPESSGDWTHIPHYLRPCGDETRMSTS